MKRKWSLPEAELHKDPGGFTLVDLPSNVLEEILSNLSTDDVKLLLLVNKEHRTELLPLLFASTKATWDQITDSKSFHHRDLIQSIRVSAANSYNEYKQNTFGALLAPEQFPSLLLVLVHTVNLSYWLKYNHCSHVRALTLYSDDARSVKIFHMAHVANFTGLEELCLYNYHFNWAEEEDVTSKLRTLDLHDCTWEYPFNLARFNLADLLETLSVSYSTNNAFVLLERFVNFLLDPFPLHSSSLRNVTVEFVAVTDTRKLLTPAILLAFIRAFDRLDTLSMLGWKANVHYLRTMLQTCEFEYPLMLKLQAELIDGSERSEAAINAIPNLTFRLSHT